ncbi:MAG: putative baseplate assembly protein [Bacillota bacterium]
MSGEAPQIEPRDSAAIFKKLREITPFYVPEWRMEDKDASFALWKCFGYLLGTVINRLNKVSDKHFLAFLEMLGVKQLPAQPSKGPLTFILSQGAGENVRIPARTQVAAGEVTFETDGEFWATPAQLSVMYGVDPSADGIFTPPPYFMVDEERTPFVTALAATAKSGDNELFLEDASGLAVGDYVKIGGKECCTVGAVEGERVTLRQKLSAVYGPGETVEKVLDFEPYTGLNVQEHAFYLGHDYLFNLKKGTGRGHVLIKLYLKASRRWQPADLTALKALRWQYCGEEARTGAEKWLPFRVYRVTTLKDAPDTAEVGLWKICGRQTLQKEIDGVSSYWVRAVASAAELALPALSHVRAAVFNLAGVDMAFANDVPVNLESDFYPFGATPRVNDTFYLASQESFTKKGETVDIHFGIAASSSPAPTEDLSLSWEYWNGKGWQAVDDVRGYLKRRSTKEEVEYKFQGDGGVCFTCPKDFEPTKVNGQKNYWLRVKILSGGYGLEQVLEIEKMIYKSLTAVRPPLLDKVRVKLAEPQKHYLDCALTYNALQFCPITAASRGGGEPIKAFASLEETHPTLYLGFDRKVDRGPVSIFFSVEEQVYEEEDAPRWEWQYYREKDGQGQWVRLEVEDGTRNMTVCGAVAFVVPEDAARLYRFGARLYYLRAVDIKDRFCNSGPDGGSYSGKPSLKAKPVLKIPVKITAKVSAAISMPVPPLRIKGIYLNTTWVEQLETIQDEILGSGSGAAGESFALSKTPVVQEEIWVNEAGGAVAGDLKLPAGTDVVEVAGRDGKTKDVWVKWRPVADFGASRAADRNYIIDAAGGVVVFGDGVRGAIPPTGRKNIKATYRCGGGVQGNVDKDSISTLKTALAFVDKVRNPQAAGGGTEVESVPALLARGPWSVRHRGRAVTSEDFEQLAKEASRDVARARCLPNCDRQGNYAPGWTTVLVIPDGRENKPALTPQLKRRIEDYLKTLMSNVVVAAGRLQVIGPVYAEISLRAVLVTRNINAVSSIENQALRELESFLHPLTGGRQGNGWEFGRAPCVTDFYSLFEQIPDVDHVDGLSLAVGGEGMPVTEIKPGKQTAPEMPPWGLICSSGRHELKVEFKGV